jgi:hypothetical protein
MTSLLSNLVVPPFKVFFVLLISFWSLVWAQPCQDVTTITPSTTLDAFNATTTMQTCYTPGASDTVSFTISPKSADLSAPRAVVVFDIVKNDGKGFPSVVLQVIDVYSLEVNPDIFRDSLDMALVQAGLQGEISFRMQPNAPVGNYLMVISVFRLPEGLRPRDVTYDPNALAGRVFYGFRIEE